VLCSLTAAEGLVVPLPQTPRINQPVAEGAAELLDQGSGTYGSRAIYGSSGDSIWIPDNFEFKKIKISARPPVIFSIAPVYSRSNLRSFS